MPVSTRHMRNGAHNSRSRSTNMPSTLPERLGEGADVVVDGRDVVVRALDGADRAGDDDDFCPRLLRHALRELAIVPWLEEHGLDLLLLHLLDQAREMTWRRWDPGTVLDHAEL